MTGELAYVVSQIITSVSNQLPNQQETSQTAIWIAVIAWEQGTVTGEAVMAENHASFE